MSQYPCIIAEDNIVDSLMAQAMVKRYPWLSLDGVFDRAETALAYIRKHPVDVLFTDVEMDGMDGLELRRQAQELPACIFITSFPEYAVDSFGLSALDYIVKPLTADRFDAAMKRLQDYMEIRRKAALFDYSLGEQSIFIKEGTQQVKIALHEVEYLEALRDYTRVVTAQRTYCVLGTLQHMLGQKSFKSFVRVHRSYAVQRHFVTRIESGQVHLNNNCVIPLGRSYRESALSQLAS